MAGLGPFRYIIDDASVEFFQTAAEDMGKEAAMGATARQLAAAAGRKKALTLEKILEYAKSSFGRRGKLAMLVHQSNQNDLVKEAQEALFSGENIDSYSDMLNAIAASSPWEPLGMTNTAIGYLEKSGAPYELVDHILGDCVETDSVIQAVMDKEADDTRSLEELVKNARLFVIPRAYRALFGAGEAVGKAGKAVGRAGKVVGRTGKKYFTGGYGGLFERAGRHAATYGPAETLAKPFRGLGRVEMPVQRAYMRHLGRKAERRAAGKVEIKRQIGEAKTKLRGLSPASGEALSEGRRLKSLRAQLKRQKRRIKGIGKEQTRLQGMQGIAPAKAPKTKKVKAPKTETAAPTAAPTPTRTPRPTGPAPAMAAATAAKPTHGITTRKAKAHYTAEGALKKPQKADTAKAERAAAKTREQMAEVPPKGRAARERAEELYGAKKGTVPKKKKKKKKGSPEQKPAPSEQKEFADVAKPGTPLGDIWKKWNEGGWAALSSQEKRKVYAAIGVTFVAQRAVLEKPVI